MTPTPLLPAIADPAPADPPGRAWVRWALLAGFWGLIAVVDATQSRFYFDLWEPHHGWADAFQRTLPSWAVWALFTPLIFHLARRFPLERGTLARRLPVHLGAALGLITLHNLIVVGTAFTFGWPYEYQHTPGMLLVKQFTNKTHTFLMIYFAVLGVFHALSYHRRMREREVAASQLQARLAEAQLQALRTQIHPHFLFNTLNAISVLVLKGETQCAIRMLSRLSDLLRITLEGSGAQEVTLREELDFLARYLDIERVRFQDRLTVETEVDPAALDAPVPHLLLQPLVENAVRHGIAQTMGAGTIHVTARRVGERLRLEVRDTGPGLAEDGAAADGIGLSNTRARLERLYGAAARFELRNHPDGGCVATVELPFRAGAPAPAPSDAEPALAAASA